MRKQRKLRIGIDTRVLCNEQRRGVAQYVYSLVSELLETSGEEEYHLIVDRKINPINILDHPNLIIETVPECRGYRINSWLHYKLVRHILRNKYDLFFYPHNVCPIVSPVKSIVGIHDAKIFRNRITFLGQHGSDGGRYLPGAIKKAEKVICMSRFTLSEIEVDTGPLSNAVVIHEGISPKYDILKLEESERKNLKSKYGIKNKFILALGASAKYKNIEFLVKSYSRIKKRLPDELQLLLVGNQDENSIDYMRTIDRLDLQADVICTGFVPDDDLIRLYNCAECFVYPSLYEGFGFPPLEAMACGVPVLTSNVSSIPEIVRDACVMADATNEGDFERALYGLLDQLRNKEYRDHVSRKGYLYAKSFSWRRTAENTLETFYDVVNGTNKVRWRK